MKNKIQKDNPPTYTSLYGAIAVIIGVLIYSLGAFLGFIRFLLKSNIFTGFIEFLLWYSALPIIVGFFLIVITLPQVRLKKNMNRIMCRKIEDPSITIGLTAYNDEESIGLAVADFKSHKLVRRVIVIDNNSSDKTSSVARDAGAIVYLEEYPGYGSCAHRALTEIIKHEDTNICILCEGDLTFRSADIDKFVSYLPHAKIVNGTRIVDVLQQGKTQVSVFMHYGNLFVSKLLEIKYFGSASLTDVGTTYKAFMRADADEIMSGLNSKINLEFNAHFIENSIKNDLKFVEIPITFHPRVGLSKGGNVSNRKALSVGMRMIYGIVFGWDKLI